MLNPHDTIVAPATASGGAIAVIRVSGAEAIAQCDALFRGRQSLLDAPGGVVRYGRIVEGEQTIDDVVVTLFRAPHSYTGEDTVEIACHGSRYIVSTLLDLLTRRGVRMAAPGEFTQRAFLAGRLDLSQAEAVADLIAADTQATHAMASTQMRGGYSEALGTLRDELLHLCALLELELDFSEEEVEFADRRQLAAIMEELSERIGRLVRSFTLGNVLREGVAVAIVGEPNVGKSTLLNRLLGEERALVSEIAGTTRDTIEERLQIDGVTFRLIDTAGLHATDDHLEQMGIRRTEQALAKARIILQITDATRPAPAPIPTHEGQTLLRVVNKSDLIEENSSGETDALSISARTGAGIDTLLQRMRATIDTTPLFRGDPIVSNARHAEALRLAAEALDRARHGLGSSPQDKGNAPGHALPTDLLSEEIRQVAYHLGTITGSITSDEILGSIFANFCIGK